MTNDFRPPEIGDTFNTKLIIGKFSMNSRVVCCVGIEMLFLFVRDTSFNWWTYVGTDYIRDFKNSIDFIKQYYDEL